MFSLSTCPIDKGQTEFYGMARYRTIHHPRPVFVRWYQCQSCRGLHAVNDFGKILHTRMNQFSKDEIKRLFPRGKTNE